MLGREESEKSVKPTARIRKLRCAGKATSPALCQAVMQSAALTELASTRGALMVPQMERRPHDRQCTQFIRLSAALRSQNTLTVGGR
jgi:hypothetical protein